MIQNYYITGICHTSIATATVEFLVNTNTIMQLLTQTAKCGINYNHK